MDTKKNTDEKTEIEIVPYRMMEQLFSGAEIS